ncbi:MAG: 16S rRNA (uracil(1498)-N(3))-methyltransferase [Lentisphaerae bacterium]|nr:16S rRNA (uracil(1498)-N(3))-methyltransferase [Lentisphaerota bacterium]
MAIRCFIPPDRWTAAECALPPEETRHLHVLRVRHGDTVIVFDGEGRAAEAELVSIGRRDATVRIREATRQTQPLPPLFLTLIQAIPKGTVMDSLVEKAVELGVSEIVPLMTERVVVRLDPVEARHREERWRRVALSAARQCGVNRLTVIRPVCPWASLTARIQQAELCLFGSLQPSARPFKDVAAACRARQPRRIAFVIGPEGDLTDGETADLLAAGAVPVSFGPLVLRVETAALYAVILTAHEFQQCE